MMEAVTDVDGNKKYIPTRAEMEEMEL